MGDKIRGQCEQLAPDGLTAVVGYPGDDDKGGQLLISRFGQSGLLLDRSSILVWITCCYGY
jgi:hypothetical protein